MKLLLVRHGQTDYNVKKIMQGHTDIPLNDHGRNEAKQLAQYTKSLNVDAMFSSDLSRAWETAQIITESMSQQIPISKLEILREKFMGKVEGVPLKDAIRMAAEDPTVESMRDFGESLPEFEARALAAHDKLMQLSQNAKCIMVVSHGGFLKCLMRALIDKGLIDGGEHSEKVGEPLRNCSLSIIENGVLTNYNDSYSQAIDADARVL